MLVRMGAMGLLGLLAGCSAMDIGGLSLERQSFGYPSVQATATTPAPDRAVEALPLPAQAAEPAEPPVRTRSAAISELGLSSSALDADASGTDELRKTKDGTLILPQSAAPAVVDLKDVTVGSKSSIYADVEPLPGS